MYLEFYGLKEQPFRLTPDPTFLYYSKAHKRAVAFLKYGLQESKGFLQLTGPVGSGKTTLLRAILGELDESARTAYIINPAAPFPDLLRSIMKDLEIPNIPPTRIKIELLDFFHDYLLLQMRRHNTVIVIFDEAQNISLKNLEEIRMLSNFETTKGKLIQIVFVGQPELIETLNNPDLRQLKQRIQVRYNLLPLSQAEIQAYIDHRLKVAGSDGSILFEDSACKMIYDFSGGIPRLINSVCDVALLIGYVSESKIFDAEIIKEAIKELDGAFSNESPGDPEPEGSEGPADGEELDEGEESIHLAPGECEASAEKNPGTALSSGTKIGDEASAVSNAGSSSPPQVAEFDNEPENFSLHDIRKTSLAVIETDTSVNTDECFDFLSDSADTQENEEQLSADGDIGARDDEPSDADGSAEPPILVPERRTSEHPDSSAMAPDKHVISEKDCLDEMSSVSDESVVISGGELQSAMQAIESGQDTEVFPFEEVQAVSDSIIEPDVVGEVPDRAAGSPEPEDRDNAEKNEAIEQQVAAAKMSSDLQDLMPTICIPSTARSPWPGARSPRPHEGMLHSYLRHSKTGRFRVGNSRNARFAGAEPTFSEKIVRIFSRGNGAATGGSVNDEDALPEENETGILDKEHGRKKRRPGKRGYLSLQKNDTMKVAALTTDGRVILGRTNQISVREKGVYLSPPEARNNKTQQFIPFKHTLALRFLADYEDGWKRNCSPKTTSPTGREVVATLLNGEVIEGSTPRKFDTECLRFFVLMHDDKGEPSWTLVERAGTVGILTEDFKEGIYANEPLSLVDLLETFILTDEKICQHESLGDEFFSAGDLDAALREYALALENGHDRERIEIKIALCHFNCGTKYLMQNKYQEAKMAFLEVNAGSRLLEKARSRAIMIERMVGANGIASARQEKSAPPLDL